MNNSNTLSSYLYNCYAKSGDAYTHTRIGDDSLNVKGGSYFIAEENENKFYELYHKQVFKQKKQEYLTEKQYFEKGTLCVDIDLRYDPEIEEKQHTKEHVLDLLDLYCENLKSLLHIPPESSFPIYIFEKPDVNMLDNITKDGIHIIFGINLDRVLHIMLRSKIITEINDIWTDLPKTNSWSDVFDERITRGKNNWQLYGSRKPGNQAYELKYYYTCTIDNDNKSILKENCIKKFKITPETLPKLSIRYKKNIEFEMNSSVNSEEYERIFNSLKSNTNVRKSVIIEKSNNISYGDITSREILTEAVDSIIDQIDIKDYEVKEAHLYVMCLTENFYEPYDKWIRVGWALRNTSDKLFLTWMLFSSRSQKFSFDQIEEYYQQWCGFKNNTFDGLTKRSIIYWAKRDNPPEYYKIREKTIDFYIENCISSPTEFDIAVLLYNMYKDRFCCVAIERNKWYEYNNHRWLECDSGTELRKMISKDIYNLFIRKMNETHENTTSAELDTKSEKWNAIQKRSRKLSDICPKLKTTPFKNNIMREARELFYDSKFLNSMDSNTSLLCFSNGVVDFKEQVFRPGIPEDNISKCTNIDYNPLDSKLQHLIDEINDFMEKLFPNRELRNYMWDHLASTLVGDNNDQTFNIYNGCGSNGKSKLIELMSLCLGDYKVTVPIQLVTQKRTSIGSTSSEIVQLMGTRFAVMQEPTKGDKLNEGILKEITGGDPLQGRALFKESVTFIPQFKLVVCTNTLLDVNSNDEGTWRRIRLCDFVSKFVDSDPIYSPEKDIYQFQKDKNLGNKIKTWAPVFIAMLVERAYKTHGLVGDCSIVMAKSESYRNTQDCFSEFISERIIAEEGQRITQTTLKAEFKDWYELQYGGKVPRGKDLFDYFTKKFGKRERDGWKNITFANDE